MFTRDERRALLGLALLAAAGGLMRVVRAPDQAPGAPAVAPELAGEDVARQMERVRRVEALSRPLAADERVDLDRAGAAEIERLPRIGPALAQRIVEERQARGPFGSIAGLARVSGVGPGIRAAIERKVSFSGVALPAAVSAGAVAGSCPQGPIALNRATEAELVCLPGVGPRLAARIAADRASRGGYREVKDLERVAGIGPALLARLAGSVVVP